MRLCIIAAISTVLAGAALAEPVRYLGPHPLPARTAGRLCLVEGSHVHDFAPHLPLLYVRTDSGWAFVGDPTEYQKEGRRVAYYGHHPVFWARSKATPGAPPPILPICYINGPHHHWYAPPPGERFVAKGGVHWWVGGMPPGYVRRWHKHSPVDDHYAKVTLQIPRPVVTIAPPAGYVGFYIGPGYHRVYHIGPSVDVVIEGGGRYQGHGHGGHGDWGHSGHGGKWD